MPNNQSLSSTVHQQSHSSNLLNNQNLLHVKFHVNKIQENLLSKRLKQLNEQEMKLRLKNQRTSNDLVNFLNDCKQSTGYLSKMKPQLTKATSTLGLLEQKKYNLRRQSRVYSDLESNTSSSFELNCFDNDETITKSRNNGLSRPKLNRNFCFKSFDLDKSSQSTQIDNELIRMITPLKSLPETNNITVSDCIADTETIVNKIPSLFEQILSRSETNSSTPTSTQFSCSNSSQNNSSKASASSRSNCSTCSSHDNDNPLKENCLKQDESFRKLIRPTSCSTTKYNKNKQSKSKLSDSTTISNIDWLTSTFTFDLDLDSGRKKSNEINSKKTSIISMTNELSSISKRIPSAKSSENQNKKTKKSFKKSEFKSRSLNLLLNSTDFTTASFKTSIRQSIDTQTEASMSSFCSNDTTRSKQQTQDQPKYSTRKSLFQKQYQPIQINMSRNLIRKKQIGLINDYKNLSSMEFIKSLRQIQQNLDTKVKQFSNNNSNANLNTIEQTV